MRSTPLAQLISKSFETELSRPGALPGRLGELLLAELSGHQLAHLMHDPATAAPPDAGARADGAELARRANVSRATISHALNGRRIHPAKFRKIASELHKAEPMPGIETLIRGDGTASVGDLTS